MELVKAKTNAARMTVRFDDELTARLNAYHEATDIPKTRIISRALKQYLDELEEDYADARAGEAAWVEYIASGRKSISLEEYAQKEGIDLDD